MTLGRRYDVIIVGAGPAGSSCAILLARAGYRVLLCDKAKFPRQKICGECINPKCWPLLRILGASDQILAAPQTQITQVRVSNAQRIEISHTIPHNTLSPFVAVRRSRFDHVLLELARSSGAEILEKAQVVDLRHKGQWSITARVGRSNSPVLVTSDLLVGADGRNSIVAAKLGQNGRVAPNIRRVAVQWHTQFQPFAGSSVELFLFDSGYCGLVNVDRGTANVAMVTLPETAALAGNNFASFLDQTLLQNPRAKQFITDLSPADKVSTTYPINPLIRQSSALNSFLIGDARRTVEPFTGEGIYYALHDGIETANEIIALRRGLKTSRPTPSIPFANVLYSSVLQRPWLAGKFVSLGSMFPKLEAVAFRNILNSAGR